MTALNPDDLAKAREMRDQRMSWREIGLTLHRRPEPIRDALVALGCEPDRRVGERENKTWTKQEEVHHGYEDGYRQLASAIVVQAIVDVETPRGDALEALAWLHGECAFELANWGCDVDRDGFKLLLTRLTHLVVERRRWAEMRWHDTLDWCAIQCDVR